MTSPRGVRRLEILRDLLGRSNEDVYVVVADVFTYYQWIQEWIREYVDWIEEYEDVEYPGRYSTVPYHETRL